MKVNLSLRNSISNCQPSKPDLGWERQVSSVTLSREDCDTNSLHVAADVGALLERSSLPWACAGSAAPSRNESFLSAFRN